MCHDCATSLRSADQTFTKLVISWKCFRIFSMTEIELETFFFPYTIASTCCENERYLKPRRERLFNYNILCHLLFIVYLYLNSASDLSKRTSTLQTDEQRSVWLGQSLLIRYPDNIGGFRALNVPDGAKAHQLTSVIRYTQIWWDTETCFNQFLPNKITKIVFLAKSTVDVYDFFFH